MAFGRRKKKEDDIHKGDLVVADGVYLKQAHMKNGHIILNCFLRALIVFFLVLGSIGGFLSAFDISYNFIMVVTVFLILSMYFSFLYASSKFLYRDFGYIVFFILFVGAIYVLRIYANSGFYVIVNNVLDHARIFFELPGVREYEVQISNDFLTVSIVTCFLGMLMIIVLNIWMYSIMSLLWTVLFTFPLLFIPIYMKLSPSLFYMILMSIGYLAVIIFKANGHYVVFAWDTPFKTRGILRKRVSYTQDSGIFKQIIISLSFISVLITVLAESIINPNTFEQRFKSNRLWNLTSESIGNFLLLGFSSMYNQYPNTGGMSSGKLGGVSNVRPDYLTDLRVRFVPYSNDAIYLKGYTGGLYGDNEWIGIYDDRVKDGQDDRSIFEEESLKSEASKVWNDFDQYSGYGYMDIYNAGADGSYLYYPYYTLFKDYSIYDNRNLFYSTQGIPIGDEVKYSFYPKIFWNELGNVKPKDMDVSGVNPDFLDVPAKNKQVLDEICEEIGLNEDMTENEIVAEVSQFFIDNYPYTLKPGQTPEGEDFINYFLTENKKGFCAHFASSATLLFRNMGIPARYIEGYAFSMETVFASDPVEDLNPDEYYYGFSLLGEAPVMEVEVNDSQAHAWVEIYVDGFGWRNIEVTPGSNEETDEDSFWTAFSRILQGDINASDNTNGTGNILNNINIRRYSWIIYAVLMLILLFIIAALLRIIIRKVRRYMRCNQENRRDALIARYADICDMERLCNKDFDICRSHKEQLEYMKKKYDLAYDVDSTKEELEKMSFHDEYLKEEQVDSLSEIIQNISKSIYKNAEFMIKIKLLKR